MQSKKYLSLFANHLLIVALAATIFYLFMFPARVQAGNNPAGMLPTLEEFVEQVRNGDADALRGTYIPNVLALPVIQQPAGGSNYVASMRSALTQFNMASRAGNVGLLAHNYLAGRLFFELQPDDLIILVYGNARTEIFVVERIHSYEALPGGIYKNTATQDALNIGELFEIMYGGERHVTLQTCIAKGDDLSWGRLFVVAKALHSEKTQESLPLPGVVAAPPPPPPVVLLGWPLNYFRLATNNSVTITQP